MNLGSPAEHDYMKPMTGPDREQARKQRIKAAAERALAEAEARRNAQALAAPSAGPVEAGGAVRLQPTRYGDWEKSGIAIDF